MEITINGIDLEKWNLGAFVEGERERFGLTKHEVEQLLGCNMETLQGLPIEILRERAKSGFPLFCRIDGEPHIFTLPVALDKLPIPVVD